MGCRAFPRRRRPKHPFASRTAAVDGGLEHGDESNSCRLVVAVQYRRSVEAQLLQILNETKEACGIAGSHGNAWTYQKQELWYSSPWVDDQKDIYVEFGFDFDRDDADWSVPHLSLPSAYFAAIGTDRPELGQLQNWEPAPTDWGDAYLRVKRLGCLQVQGNSLHGEYLRFVSDRSRRTLAGVRTVAAGKRPSATIIRSYDWGGTLRLRPRSVWPGEL